MADDQESILKVIVELVDKVSEPLRKVNESFEEFSESVHGILTSGAEVFAGYEAIKGLVEPAMAMAEAQTHLALASNFSAEQLAKLKEQAAALSESFPASMEAVTGAQEEMFKTFGASDLEEHTKLAVQLATVLGVDATSGANALAAAYEQLGDKSKPVTEQMGIIGDKLAVLKNLYMKPGEASSLERDIQRLGKSAQAAGISQNQMFAIWAEGNKLHAGGPRGFGMVEASLFDTLAKSSKELEKAGLRVAHFKDTGGVNMIGTLEEINKLSQHGKMKLFSELPGQSKVLVEMAAHLQDIKKIQQGFRDSGGALGKSSDVLANTPEARMERLKNTFENLGDTIGTQTLPQIIAIVGIMEKWLTAIDKFLNDHPAVAKALGDIALGIAALLTAGGAYGFVKIIGNVIKLGAELLQLPAILGMVRGAWFVLQTAMIDGSAEIGTAMLLAFESNPIGWILTALAAVAFVSYEIWKHWDDITSAIVAATEAVKNFVHVATVKDWIHTGFDFATGNYAGAAVDVATAGGGSGAGMTYAPTVHVNVAPGTDARGVGNAVVEAMSGHASELDQFLRDRQHETSRRSFGDPTMSMFGR